MKVASNLSGLVVVVLALSLLTQGCETGGQTGSLAGAGIGALAGQIIGGDTKGTLIGAAVGGGVGYIVGNEKDKKHAKQLSNSNPPTHAEVGVLGGTRWVLASLNPQDYVDSYISKVIEFKPNGRVITTTTKPDGSVDIADESYRIVDSTLIINKPGYLVNARFSISGNQLIVSADKFSAVLKRAG